MNYFSLSKSTLNHNSSPRIRTAIVKFDYESADPEEFCVLAKEVRFELNETMEISLGFLDCQYSFEYG